MNVKGLAGKWNAVWQHYSKSLERILGKENTIAISREGTDQVVAPFVSEKHTLSESANDALPAHAGWYVLEMGDSAVFILRLDGAGSLEIHYFDSSPRALCERTFSKITKYCAGAGGTRWNKSRQGSTNITSQLLSHR